MTAESQPVRRQGAAKKRGASPGNRNALTHGFYARHFRPDELADLAALGEGEAEGGPLAPEIALLRVRLRRLLETIEQAEAEGKELNWLAWLNGLGLASLRIARLMRMQKALNGGEEDGSRLASLTSVVSQALAEITRELKL